MNESKIIIIIPAYNEEKNLADLLHKVKSIYPDFDVLIIDDASKDQTKKAANIKGIKLISLPFNLGIGAAVQTGLKYADRNNYDYLVRMDGDGQHPVEEVNRLLDKLYKEQADVIIGTRYHVGFEYRGNKIRRLATAILSNIVSFITGQKFSDVTSGFIGLNKKSINFLSTYYPEDYPEVESIIKLKQNNFKIIEIPVQMNLRESGQTSISSINSIYYMIRVVLAIIIFLFKKRDSE